MIRFTWMSCKNLLVQRNCHFHIFSAFIVGEKTNSIQNFIKRRERFQVLGCITKFSQVSLWQNYIEFILCAFVLLKRHLKRDDASLQQILNFQYTLLHLFMHAENELGSIFHKEREKIGKFVIVVVPFQVEDIAFWTYQFFKDTTCLHTFI